MCERAMVTVSTVVFFLVREAYIEVSGVVIRVEPDVRDMELCSEPTVPAAEDEDEDESSDSEDALWGESRVSLCCPASREALERTFGRVETERASAIAHGSMTIAAESVREVLGEM